MAALLVLPTTAAATECCSFLQFKTMSAVLCSRSDFQLIGFCQTNGGIEEVGRRKIDGRPAT